MRKRTRDPERDDQRTDPEVFVISHGRQKLEIAITWVGDHGMPDEELKLIETELLQRFASVALGVLKNKTRIYHRMGSSYHKT